MSSQRPLAPHVAAALQAGSGRSAPQTAQPRAAAGSGRTMAAHVAQALARPAAGAVARGPSTTVPTTPPHARPGALPLPPRPPLRLGATVPAVQAKVAVAVSGVLKGEENLTITQVRVFERTYPGEKSILGTKRKGFHRSHTLGWDLYLGSWEKEYVGFTIGDMAKDLGCKPTMLDVEDAFASNIDKKAREMVLYWGKGTSNVQSGSEYRVAKRKYEESHEKKAGSAEQEQEADQEPGKEALFAQEDVRRGGPGVPHPEGSRQEGAAKEEARQAPDGPSKRAQDVDQVQLRYRLRQHQLGRRDSSVGGGLA